MAEINAVIESLLWWASVGEAKKTNNRQHQHPIEIGEAVIFTMDSQYVVKLLQGKCRAIENKLLVDFMVHLWKFVGSIFPSESAGAQATTTLQRTSYNFQAQMLWTNWLE